MTYFIYQKDIIPQQSGKNFLGLMHFKTFEKDTIQFHLNTLGYTGDISDNFEAVEQCVTLKRVKYIVGIAQLSIVHINNETHWEISRNYEALEDGSYVLTITHDTEIPPLPELVRYKVPTLLVVDRLKASGSYAAVKAALKSLDADESSFDRFMLAQFVYSDNPEVLYLFGQLGIDANVILAPESDEV